MDFEFDAAKSAANLKKHGIDFIGAQALWSDPDRLRSRPARSTNLGPRSLGESATWCGRRSSPCGAIASGSSPSGKHAMKKNQRTSKTRTLSTAELDAMHDAGVDLSSHMDLAKAVRPGRAVQRVNVDFPVDLLREIDQEARRLGVTRQAFIKVRLADALVKTTS
jgi:hypothetical protein